RAPSISSVRSRNVCCSSSRMARSTSRGDDTTRRYRSVRLRGKLASRAASGHNGAAPDSRAGSRVDRRRRRKRTVLTGKPPRVRRRKSLLTELLPRLQANAGLARDEQLVREMMETCLKLLRDHTRVGDIKLLNAALRELRYAFKVFAPYRNVRK